MKTKQATDAKAIEAAPQVRTPWLKVPQGDGSILLVPGKPVVMEDEVGTREAAGLLGVSQRTMQEYCDGGILREGIDWRQNPARPGSPKGGCIRIKRAAVLKLRGI